MLNNISNAIEWILPILTGLSVGLAVALGYPQIEAFFMSKFKNHITKIDDLLDKMFFKNRLTESQVIGVYFGPALGFGLIGIMISLAAGSGVIGFILLPLIGMIVGFYLPLLGLKFLYWRRLNLFNDQLVDALSMISNSLKSGLSLVQAFQVIQKNMPAPISQEFGLMLGEHQLGATIEEAIQNMMNRIPSDDLYMAGSSILILRETGGNLSEVFDTMTVTIRERRKVDGKIKSMTAMGITQGAMLIGFPYVLGIAFYFANPASMSRFFTTKVGWALITTMLVLQAIGAYVIKRIVTIRI